MKSADGNVVENDVVGDVPSETVGLADLIHVQNQLLYHLFFVPEVKYGNLYVVGKLFLRNAQQVLFFPIEHEMLFVGLLADVAAELLELVDYYVSGKLLATLLFDPNQETLQMDGVVLVAQTELPIERVVRGLLLQTDSAGKTFLVPRGDRVLFVQLGNKLLQEKASRFLLIHSFRSVKPELVYSKELSPQFENIPNRQPLCLSTRAILNDHPKLS